MATYLSQKVGAYRKSCVCSLVKLNDYYKTEKHVVPLGKTLEGGEWLERIACWGSPERIQIVFFLIYQQIKGTVFNEKRVH